MTKVVEADVVELTERIRSGHPLVFDASVDALRLYEVPQSKWSEFILKTNDDISFQIRAVHAFLDLHFVNPNEVVSAHFANRILVMLRKARRFDLERDLVEAYCSRFATSQGAVHEKILHRAAFLGVSQPDQSSERS